MRVTAQAGEEILVKDINPKSELFNRVKVSPGCIEVAITVPPNQKKRGTTPFYSAVSELDQSPK